MSDGARRRPGPPGIRPGRRDELLWLQELEKAAGQRFADVGLPGVAASPPSELTALHAAHDEGLLWVAAMPAGRAIGFARALRLASSLHIAEVSVLPAHGRQGVGGSLVREVIRAGTRLAADALTLSTFSDVPWNAPFYEKLGFRRLGERDLTPELAAIRCREAEAGLPVDWRVMMKLDLPRGKAHPPRPID